MSANIAFISTASAKAIILSRNGTLTGSYCSIKDSCAYEHCTQKCEIIAEAKNHLCGSVQSSNVEVLEGERVAGIGEYRIGRNVLLKAMGLGSCVGVILYDPSTCIGGIAHILLPGASAEGKTKHAETAIKTMLEEMINNGARKRKVRAKIAGGAQIFKHMNMEMLKIGDRNIKSVQDTLKEEGIDTVATDVGGNIGRNVLFNTIDGSMIIKYSSGKAAWL
ncbi:chemotaxis protein CheD [Methanohalophilus sp.]